MKNLQQVWVARQSGGEDEDDQIVGLFNSIEDAWERIKACAIDELRHKQDHICTAKLAGCGEYSEVDEYPADVMISHLQMYSGVRSSFHLDFGWGQWRYWYAVRYPIE